MVLARLPAGFVSVRVEPVEPQVPESHSGDLDNGGKWFDTGMRSQQGGSTVNAREDSGTDSQIVPEDPVVTGDDTLVFQTDVFVEGPGS